MLIFSFLLFLIFSVYDNSEDLSVYLYEFIIVDSFFLCLGKNLFLNDIFSTKTYIK